MKPQATRHHALVALATLIVASCGGDRAEPGQRPDFDGAVGQPGSQVTDVYAPDLGIDLAAMTALPSGLYIRDLEPGFGEEAMVGDRVSVDYTGWLANGVQFDASEGTPIPFNLGVGDVITGWDEGIIGMTEGQRRVLVIPPALAYGERGRAGVIPPNATLVFDVRLVQTVHDSTYTPPDTSAAHD